MSLVLAHKTYRLRLSHMELVNEGKLSRRLANLQSGERLALGLNCTRKDLASGFRSAGGLIGMMRRSLLRMEALWRLGEPGSPR